MAVQEVLKPTEPKPVLVEWFNEHWYRVEKDGVTHWLPSVTTKLGIINKDGLAKWRGDIGNREADLRLHDAAQRGTRLHWARQVLLTNGAVIYDPWQNPVYTDDGIAELKQKYNGNVAILRTQDEMLQITKLHQQLLILKPKIIAVESKVYDIENRDAGTIDGIYYIKGGSYPIAGAKPLVLGEGLYVEDFKTGSYLDSKVWLQLAPYLKMAEDRIGTRFMGGLVTHTGASTRKGIPGLNTLFRSRTELMEKDYPDYRHASALWMREHADDQPETFQFASILSLNGGTE